MVARGGVESGGRCGMVGSQSDLRRRAEPEHEQVAEQE